MQTSSHFFEKNNESLRIAIKLTSIAVWGFLTIFFLTLPASLRAEADGPDFWAVTGVSCNDVLNIREKPSPHSKKLGTIPHNGNGITNLGCLNEMSFTEYQNASEAERKSRANQRWCKVRFMGIVGYVKGTFLKEGSGPAQ